MAVRSSVVVGSMLVWLLLAAGCISKPSPAMSLVKVTKAFSERMRWQDFNVAAAYVSERERETFLASWKENDKDLHVVGTHVDGLKMLDEETAEVSMTIDYYLLPSTTVKQVESQQEWYYRTGERFRIGSWELVSGVPLLPGADHSPQKDE